MVDLLQTLSISLIWLSTNIFTKKLTINFLVNFKKYSTQFNDRRKYILKTKHLLLL